MTLFPFLAKKPPHFPLALSQISGTLIQFALTAGFNLGRPKCSRVLPDHRLPSPFACRLALLFLSGCSGGSDKPELVWGKRGVSDGDLVKPRAIAIDSKDRLYLVDWTARIQAFDRDGKFLGPSWTPPDYRNGRPSGLSIDKDDNVVVSDSHYHCVRIYSPEGKLLRTVGGNPGTEPGQLSYISDALRDKDGNFYIAEFGDNQRITKLDADGKFVKCWGSPGSEIGQFARIRAMTLGPDGNLYLADACNHRIQVFTTDGEFVRCWGQPGTGPGELAYPYDLAFAPGPNPRAVCRGVRQPSRAEVHDGRANRWDCGADRRAASRDAGQSLGARRR